MVQGTKIVRLSKAAREFNVGISTIIDFLHKKGVEVDTNPNTKLPPEAYDLLAEEFSSEISVKKESEKLSMKHFREAQEALAASEVEEKIIGEPAEPEEEVLIKDSSGATGLIETKQPDETVTEEPPEKVAEEEKLPAETDQEKEVSEIAPIDPSESKEEDTDVTVVAKEDLETKPEKPKAARKKKKEKSKSPAIEPVEEEKEAVAEAPGEETGISDIKDAQKEVFKSEIEKLSGPTVVGKIDLPKPEEKKKPVASSSDTETKKKRRKRIKKDKERVSIEDDPEKILAEEVSKEAKRTAQKKKKRPVHLEVDEEEVQKQIKETLARLTSKGKSKGAKYRREKREAVSLKQKEEVEKLAQEMNVLKVTEFVSVSELASMMNVSPNEVISTCMSLGLFVSINQRMDAETMALIADEFGYKVEFISVDVQEAIRVEEDKEEDLQFRPPIVTVMGHVDHGKTLLLDYIRKTNVIAGEAGGITQHIGAYNVTLEDGRKITFLDTPGHEAFTAMRARGAQITDIAIIVIAADDSVMPQTVEAINHAHAAGVPIVFAINKIDKTGANPEKIKEELANMKFMTEDWGGKYQSQEISAKLGTNVDDLLEKVLLEAEMLDLKANPNRNALGSVIESSLDKGRGYVATILVQTGTLHIGDVLLAGSHFGHIKAMYNERGNKVEVAEPATPVLILGLNGAPQAGDKFNVMEGDREAREIANRREQLQREQGIRTQKHITLEEIGRRIAIGNFQELNIIIKGDVDGSVEAISDSLIKLSTEQIQVNLKHKAVGQISESDVLLAAASNAIILGFQVRPSLSARKLAEKEEIDIRLYSIIYDAIEEIKSAMEGMLSPEVKEEIVATLEVRDLFKITKVGTIAGCIVKEGKITRNTLVRVIREGIVVYTGELGSLKRFKEDVKEVASGYECGLNVANFNDIKVGDIIEGYQEFEVKKTL
ncbi:MAG: translation initiation factor IF-2 [Bacteroidales bacterium]|nr:MAG: translation initiation factor IF-2 [Bacteroidales bacterium]